MEETVEDFIERYDEWAPEYDDDYSGDDQDSEFYEECVSLVAAYASPGPDDTVVDLGTGTGAVALAVAGDADTVVGRDVSEGMLDEARAKAEVLDVENVEFGRGRFRNPDVETADVVVSNWAMHHLPPGEQRDAIDAVGELDPRRFVLSGAMFFGDRSPEDPVFCTDTVYPATVGTIVDALTDAGFAVTAVERVHDEIGVLVGERTG